MYEGLSFAYDALMADTPYGAWADFVQSAVRTFGVSRPTNGATDDDPVRQERDLVVDIGCGTGTFTRMLADAGYDVMGIDLSPEMLAVAEEKNSGRKKPVPYLCQDMRKLDLYCTAGTMVSVCDSVNYLTKPADLRRTFTLVNRFLYPSGLFIFDFHTKYYYRHTLGNRVLTDAGEEISYIWDNRWSEKSGLNRYDLTLYVRGEDGRYARYEETQVQRGYSLREIRAALHAAGLDFISAVDERTGREPGPRSERIFVIARECGKAPVPDGKAKA